MVAKDEFDFYCEDNNIILLTSLDGNEYKDIWRMKYPNDEEVTYELAKISQIDELYTFRGPGDFEHVIP